mmetsp:Transcript_32983/g.84207  ORF Transcript_32983/g.84207 Transcript_32983/m.84207 type:complete len:356 (-) Transcript_32983:612-1679(-)
MDAYFGLGSSVSVQVAADADGYGGPITGNCRAAYDNQQFTTGVVVVLSSGHSVVPKFDNAVRSLFADFVNNAEAPSSWASLDRAGCNETSTGIWSCNDTGDGSLARSDSWGGDVVTSWSFLGTNSSCPPGSADASAAATTCLTPSATEFTMYMPYQDLNVTVPAIPTDVAQYAYATENALVALPPACVQAHSLTPNLADRDGSLTMRYFRVSSSAAEYATLASYADCACGLVILLHGSSGATWSSVMYAKMMANVGHVVVMPDSMAMPDSMGLKGSGTLKTTAEIDTLDYWGSSKPYTGSCSWAGGKPFCYSTKTENIVHDSAAYREFVERNYLIRKLELDYLVQSQTALLNAFD